jgi:hypothetical protein
MKASTLPFLSIAVVIALVASPDLLAQNLERLVSTQTRLIRHEASAYQRKVAETRARAYMTSQRRAAVDHTTTKTPPKQAKGNEKSASKLGAGTSQKLPRYIAVDTARDKRSSPKAKKVVMIWDTHAETLVGNNVYDLESPPPVGDTAQFETYSAEYVGPGS